MTPKNHTARRKTKRSSRNNGNTLITSSDDGVKAKIEQFRKEIGNRPLNEEQQKIYSAFTKENGSRIYCSVTDGYGCSYKVFLESSKEIKKILIKHYRTNDGTVTALQILNMFDTVRTGTKYTSQGNVVYKKTRTKDGVEYHTVIKIFKNGTDAVLKSFHSTIGYKEKRN